MRGFQITLIMLGVLAIFPATAAEITGAFGMEFGTRIDIKNYKQLGLDTPYGLEYAFIPDNPFAPLNNYSVFVTPKTHRVYQVSAGARFTSDKACSNVLIDLEQVLEKKYDKTSKAISKDFGSMPRISFGKSSRTIEGNCSGFLFSKHLNLIYVDKQLRDQAGQEYQQTLESKKSSGQQGGDRDTSGL